MDQITPRIEWLSRTKDSLKRPDLKQYNREIIERFDADVSGEPQSVKYAPPEYLGQTSVETPTDRLYRDDLSLTSDFQAALRSVKAACQRTDRAIELIRRKNFLDSAHEVHAVESLLPELFRSRSLAPGYEAVVAAIIGAFVNKKGGPWNEAELMALRELLENIAQRHIMQYESAMEAVILFEDSGLQPAPPAIEIFAELFSD